MHKFIRVVSDLHLEAFIGRPASELRSTFIPADARDAESILVLAGDISSKPFQLIEFIKDCEHQFPLVLYVPGNHEVYRHNMDQWNIKMRAEFDKLQKTAAAVTKGIELLELEGVRFIFGTMWGDGGHTPSDMFVTSRYLNDFRLIFHGPAETPVRFTVHDMRKEYTKAKQRIDQLLKVPFDGKTVVVTHHMPSRHLVHARFWPSDGSDGCNGGFVGDCENILADSHAPDLWIHGHTHCKIDLMLWNTRIVCNPTGYRGEWSLPDVGGQPTFVSLDEDLRSRPDFDLGIRSG